MRTFDNLRTFATTLSSNTSAANLTLMGQLINDGHRYLLQKYFDNERTFTTSTVGGQSLTLTGSLSIGAVSATMTATWSYPTNTQLVNFSSGEQRSVLFTSGSAALTWAVALTKTATTAISSVGVQYYSIPANISKLKNDTISIGQLKYQPTFVMTQQEWDNINFLPYTSDIPNYCYVYNGQLGIFPIPSTTGNVMTFNYKTRVADLSYSDYSVGTLATMAAGGTAVTGTSTLWTAFPQNTDIGFQNLNVMANVATGGDGLWYPISKFTSATALTLALPVVNAPSITTATTYTIGQLPLLSEDFSDMLVYYAMMTYFNSIVKDSDKYKLYKDLYDTRLELLEQYAGTKNVNVDLQAEPNPTNPNLFLYSNT